MMPSNRTTTMQHMTGIALLGLLTIAPPVLADMRTDVSGFGSIGGQRLYGDRQESDLGLPPSNTFDADWDSILGLQISMNHSNGLGLTGQAVARGNSFTGDDTYHPESEWFFASWQVNEALRIRAGRLRTPLYLYSESLEVGYSYPWVAPNANIYTPTGTSASHYDGADIRYTRLLDESVLSFQLSVGSNQTVLFGTDIDVERAYGANMMLVTDTLTLRYGFFQYTYTLDQPALMFVKNFFNGLAGTSTRFPELADAIDFNDVTKQTHALGLQWEHSPYSVDFELLYTPPSGEKFDITGLQTFVSVARQVDAHTVFVQAGYFKQDLGNDALDTLAATRNDIAVGNNAVLDLIRQGLAENLDDSTSQRHSLSAGYRYDINDQWDAKVELEHVWFDENIAEAAYITAPTTLEKGEADIVKLVTDWMF